MKILNKYKKGAASTVEFVIIIVLLTIFLFLPFALYSSYQKKAIVEDMKERALQMISVYGETNHTVVETIAKEIKYYGLIPKKGQSVVVTFSNVTQSPNSDEVGSTEGRTIIFYTYDGTNLKGTVISNYMIKATKANKDIIFCEFQVPSDNFLNSILGLLGQKIENNNDTGAELAYKAIGYKASEYILT